MYHHCPPTKLLRRMVSSPPSTRRRSTRRVVPAQRQEAPATPAMQPPRGGPRTAAHDRMVVQTLLKLPGFHFTNAKNVFSTREGSQLATILGARLDPEEHKRSMAAGDQRLVCLRVAHVIETCCDEWLENWQEKPLTSDFWKDAAERLRCHTKFWANTVPTPVQVNTVCMAYTRHWDQHGRGGVSDNPARWGFNLSELTWGNARADIDPDWFAKPWEYERACG